MQRAVLALGPHSSGACLPPPLVVVADEILADVCAMITCVYEKGALEARSRVAGLLSLGWGSKRGPIAVS